MIEIKNVCKKYDYPVLCDINLTIDDASIFGLIGINGAGKSTLLNMLSGVMDVDSGEILYDGEKVYENNAVKSQVFYLPDEPFFTMNTTPKNILDTYKIFYDIDYERYYQYLEKFHLPKEKSMYNFSKGMKRQVFVALALAIRPKYLFLDETFDGLDPFARLSLKRALIELVDENQTTVIISSHSLRELADICDSYGIIDHKKVSSFGEVDELLHKYHKYTMAFETYKEEDDFEGIKFFKYSREKRIVSCVTLFKYEEMVEKMERYNPIILEEVPLDFEEEFMIEVEARGKKK